MSRILDQLRQRATTLDRMTVREGIGDTPIAPLRPPQTLSEKLAAKASQPHHVANLNHEIERVLAIPIPEILTPAEIEAENRSRLLSSAFDSGFRLLPPQLAGIRSYERCQGGFFPIGVGWGKTLLGQMIANRAFAGGIQQIVLLLPPGVVGQFIQDVKWARSRIPFGVPVHVMAGRASSARRAMAKARRPGLYVVPYSLLSTRDTDELLATLAPGLVIADEAHHLSTFDAARTKRVMRHYLRDQNPDAQFVAMSGTVTSKTVMDYHHLIARALGVLAPLPIPAAQARRWGDVLDAGAPPTGDGGPILRLSQWAREHFPAEHSFLDVLPGFRAAYRTRMARSPGVVISGDAQIGTSLVIHNEPAEQPGAELSELIRAVEQEWVTPNGDEIDYAIHKYKWLLELSSGFYNSLVWPTLKQLAQRRRISETEASTVLERSKNQHAAEQSYTQCLRAWLQTYSRPGIDTPLLVGAAMYRTGASQVGEELFELWTEARAQKFEGMISRDEVEVRVDDYKIRHMVRWADMFAKKGQGGIVWCYHNAMLRWARERLEAAGIPVLFAPAGSNEEIADPDNKDRIVVASIDAHGTGKNLQHFRHNFFLQWPRPARTAEQTIGRTHRTGQTADELVICTNLTLLFDQLLMAASINDALYIHSTTDRQKIIIASWDPLPAVFTPETLRSRGFEPVMLSQAQQQALREKFGDLQRA